MIKIINFRFNDGNKLPSCEPIYEKLRCFENVEEVYDNGRGGMIVKEDKKVTYKHLKIGRRINGTEYEKTRCGFTGYVKDINSAYVTVEMWRQGGEERKVDSRSIFLIPMTEEEIIEKYNKMAGKIIEAIQNRMHRDEIGEKEMWNAWLSSNPWEMAQLCKNKKITVIGHCRDIAPKHAMFSGDVLDIGVCAEDEDGYRFWCHFRSDYITTMKKNYQRYQEYKKEGKNFKDVFKRKDE